jgi:hypothetical protein
MNGDTSAFLAEWHRLVADKDLDALREVLADDIRMGAPPYWARLQGKQLVHHLLGLIVHTIEDFTYHREWADGHELALEFKGHVGELDLQGIDLITLGEDGKIHGFDVLMRPENAIGALRELIAPQMAEFLSRAAKSRG